MSELRGIGFLDRECIGVFEIILLVIEVWRIDFELFRFRGNSLSRDECIVGLLFCVALSAADGQMA